MKSSVVTPGITNHFVPICKRKKYVRTSRKARRAYGVKHHAHPS